MADANEGADDRPPRSPPEAVLARTTDAVVALNREWELTYLDPDAEALFERPAEDLLGTDVREALPAIRDTAFERECERALETGDPVSFDEYYPPLETWFEVRAYPSETGLSVFFDSVAGKRNREREAYETIVETVDDGIFAVDETGTILEVNDAYASLTGYPREELIGETPAFLADEDTVSRYERIHERLLSGERESVTMSADVVTADGDRVPTETTLSPFSFEETTGIIGVVREIRERKRYQRQLELLHDATREVMAATTRREVGEIVVETTEEILDLPALALYFWDEDEGRLVPGLTTEDCEDLFDDVPTFTGAESLAWDAFIENEIRAYDDVRTEEDCFNPETVIRSELLAPLGDHGLLVSGSTDPGFHEPAHVDLISILTANATVALDRVEREQRVTERREQLRRQTRRLEQLARINSVVRDVQRALVGASTRREAATSICENVVSVDPYRFAWVGSADGSGTVRPDAWAGEGGDFLDHLNARRGNDEPRSPAERAVETGECVVVDSVFDEESFPEWRKEALGRGFQSALSLPLTSNGTVHGVVEIYASESDAFDDDVRDVFSDLRRIVADGFEMIERRQLVTSANDVEVELRATAGESFLLGVARRVDAELHVDSATLRDDGTWLLYVTTSAGAPEDVCSAFDESTVVESAKHIRTGSEDELFGVVVSEFDIGDVLMDFGATLAGLSVADDDVTLTVRVGQNVAVRGLADAYSDVLSDVELARREPVSDRPDPESSSSPSLTDRQREVLRTAYNEGFFEWPRETSGEDIADALGISNPVFHRHVRRALQKHLTERFEP